jgi:exosortase E/protease (VPEID-CTERM system)
MPLSYFLYRDDAPLPYAAMVILWIGFALAAVGSAVAVMAPLPVWRRAAASLGGLWWYAGITGAISVGAMELSQLLWEPTATLTFNLVRRLLLPVLPTLTADPVARTLSTERFAIEITSYCSGLEGVGLVLAFCTAWLICFRREYIFPRALALIPAGLAAIFALNVVRIAVLMLIGYAGYPDVALYGFHSQAGWIAFIAVACGVVLLSRRFAWLYRMPATPATVADQDNPTATYLMPLLAILAAGMISHAISGSFEYFYPLRVMAALAALGFFWRKLAVLDWRCSWRGPAIGVAVFLVWFIGARYLMSPTAMPERLAAMSTLLRSGWIFCRIVGSVVFVPIAEELAYRGYLMRRLCDADFRSVSYRSVSGIALLASAVLFGLAHGTMWLPGILAGGAYGLLVMRSGQLGESVVAHATSNALIAASALLFGQWQLW